ncbi:hypothetical protein RB195_003040 [Necator americanus]|uniref:Uncharacterized protein n=1 Tax=Necator americanus TaxID=51031 RepID=A0ABR1DPL1_NECAM
MEELLAPARPVRRSTGVKVIKVVAIIRCITIHYRLNVHTRHAALAYCICLPGVLAEVYILLMGPIQGPEPLCGYTIYLTTEPWITLIHKWLVFTERAGPSISSTRFVPSPLSSKMFSSFVSDVDEVFEPYPAELSAGLSV